LENNIFLDFLTLQKATITNIAVLLTKTERIFIDNLSLRFQLDLELSCGTARGSYCLTLEQVWVVSVFSTDSKLS
jgi:hypothetical protein